MVSTKDLMRASLNIKPKTQGGGLFDPTTGKQPISKPQQTGGSASSFKGDIFTERVTLALSKEQRRMLDALARDFQERRTSKLESINRNSVVRALVEVLRDVRFSDDEVVNNEQELIALLKRKLVKR